MKTDKILIPVSIGELSDKISILQIKLEKLKDKQKVSIVKQELDLLKLEFDKLSLNNNGAINKLLKELTAVNNNLWDIEDKIRAKEKEKIFDDEFIRLARSVYFNNDKRSSIKNDINKELNSFIIEIKQYQNY